MSIVTRSASKRGVTSTRSGRHSVARNAPSSRTTPSNKRATPRSIQKTPSKKKKTKKTPNTNTVTPPQQQHQQQSNNNPPAAVEVAAAAAAPAAAATNGVVVSPRENEFSADSWWTVNLRQQQHPNQRNINNATRRQGATPLVARCMRKFAWTAAHARKVLAAYRQFLQIKRIKEDWDATVLSPCLLVDRMWHEHILDVTNYCHDMMLLCGHVVGHNPDGGLDEAAKAERTKATIQALEDEFGEDGYDAELWLTPEQRREKQLAQKRRKLLEELKELKKTHRVHTIPKGAGRKRGHQNGKQITLIFQDVSSNSIQLVKFPALCKFSEVFKAFHEKVYEGDTPRKQLHFYTINKESYIMNKLLIPEEETAEDMNLVDGETIRVFDENDTLTIIVRDQTGETTFFKVRYRTKMGKIFQAYAERKGVCPASLRFMLDGERFFDEATSITLGLEDQNQVDCLLEQGGC